MPLYVADYLADTTHLSTEAHGAYILLLMVMWKSGGELPNEDKALARIVRATPAKWQKMKAEILGFFVVVEGNLYHKYSTMCHPKASVWQRLRKQVFERDEYICSYCGVEANPPECDHIYPASKGGPAILENLTTACIPCNRSKHDKLIQEWMQ
jgi:hypothetical protein